VKQFYSHDSKNETYELYAYTLGYLNMAFTALFSVECMLKIIAFGPRVRSIIVKLSYRRGTARHSAS